LLRSLSAQTYRDFEVLVIEGGGDADASSAAVHEVLGATGIRSQTRMIGTSPGLTRQRNVGLREARGEILCFLDDDVTVESTFLEQVWALFDRADMRGVGGITGYDEVGYPEKISWSWRVRRWLWSMPNLDPGWADQFGRNVPLSFAPPTGDCRPVGWLPGFCMIYRRPAVVGLQFDENLPTYGGEDRDFSLLVREHWRLMMCGTLRVKHLQWRTGRCSAVRRYYECGFGAGRVFAKRSRTFRHRLTFMRYLMSEFLVNLLGCVLHPKWEQVRLALAYLRGLIAGARTVRRRAEAL
jgi:cellulose synthase/poly-beta-1,6-N-acetylglucosamine synthase-like glycosyltransferase